MDRYAYLTMTLLLGIPWAMIFACRRDLCAVMLRFGILGAIAGAAAEWWYFTDYWRPPSLFGVGVISPEDFLVGFFLAGIGATIFPAVTRRCLEHTDRTRNVQLLIVFLLCLALLVIGSNILHLPSIMLTEGLFILSAMVMCLFRRDLWIVMIASGLLCGLLMIPIYFFTFHFLVPDFWDTAWIVRNGYLRLFLLPGVPVIEFLWFLSWGCIAGVETHFRCGTSITKAAMPPLGIA